MTETTTDTRVAIIEAALRCFHTQGLRKTTIVDITRAAAVSRSTVYEYFADYASQRFYRELARGMDRGTTLEDKLANAAVVVMRGRRFLEPERYFDADA